MSFLKVLAIVCLVLGVDNFILKAQAANTASFVKTDTTTQGNWKGVYGVDGSNVIADTTSYPSYAVITPSGQTSYTWAATTTDPRALLKASSGRIAATWFSYDTFAVDVNLTDSVTHQIALYALDWDSTVRSERIDVLDATTNQVLDTQTVSGFNGGKYLVWSVSGHVIFNFTTLAGGNSVVSGIFFDTVGATKPVITQNPANVSVTVGSTATFTVGAGGSNLSYQWQSRANAGSTFANVTGATSASYITPATVVTDGGKQFQVIVSNSGGTTTSGIATLTVNPASLNAASFVKTDTTTQGNWKGVYGVDGSNVIADTTSYPSYAVITPSGQTSYTWAATTTDPRALLKVSSGRIAATWFSYDTFAVDVNLTDGVTHQIALYALDWDSTTRSERIDVLDATTNQVLNTQSVSGFNGGKYLVWSVSGHVIFNFTTLAGGNSVVSGIFFDTVGAPAKPVITQNPANVSVTVGSNATFTVGASGSNLSYQWQSRANASSTFANITGAASASYITPATVVTDSGKQFQVIVSNSGGTTTSGIATLTVSPGFSISGTITGGAGASVALTGTTSATVTSNASGGFTFNGLPNGTYTVTPTLAGYTISPTSQTVTINGASPAALSFTASTAALQLSNNSTNYTITNDYFQAVIPKPGQAGGGLIRFLYIKKQNGQWSNNVLKQNTSNYGLGYLEGTDTALYNNPYGLSTPSVVITIVENTATRIKIQSTNSIGGTDFSETWTFWSGRNYFQSDASAVVTRAGGFLTNQLQFCWMLNDSLPMALYGTDSNGNVMPINSVIMQPINSPNLNTYPWANWQFTGENVSLGIIFTSVSEHLGTVTETGDWSFEYQMDWNLGSGVLGSAVNQGFTRALTTVYYTDNVATNTDIATFARNSYSSAPSVITPNPISQAAEYLTNPWDQNPGDGSVLMNAPYFLVRQNTQNRDIAIEHKQYETSIYGPLYKGWKTIHSGSYDFQDQLQYSLNYDSATTNFPYGTVSIHNVLNGATTSLQATANSSDGKLAYSSTLQTWNDSDKLEIQGTASNASSSASVKDIYALLSGRQPSSTWVSLGSNVYDLTWTDDIYGTMGIAVKVNSPANAATINGTELYVYLYKQSSAQSLNTFSYGLDVVIWPHKGWLSSPAGFTPLHSQDPVTYDKRTFTAP